MEKPGENMIRNPWAILVAAGSGTRLAQNTGGLAKQFIEWRGKALWQHAAEALAAYPPLKGLVLVLPEGVTENGAGLGVPVLVATGGARRQDSVRNGLEKLLQEVPQCDAVLIHDAARPFLCPALTKHLLCVLAESGAAGVIPALPVTDTVKWVEERNGREEVTGTVPRGNLRMVQTPQVFLPGPLLEAHQRARAEGRNATDDAALLEHMGLCVLTTEGQKDNVKITAPEDMNLLACTPEPCCGWGYDVHAFAPEGRPLILGGVPMPGGLYVKAHSDGDVLLHALMDAILGCLGKGDIGRLFPDSNPALDAVSSSLLLDKVMTMAGDLRLIHADLTIIAQKPKIQPHADAIRRNVARLLALPETKVNVKATTEEGLGFTGQGLGIKAVAVVSALFCSRS